MAPKSLTAALGAAARTALKAPIAVILPESLSKASASARGFLSSIVIIVAALSTTTSAKAPNENEHRARAVADFANELCLVCFTATPDHHKCSSIMPPSLYHQHLSETPLKSILVVRNCYKTLTCSRCQTKKSIKRGDSNVNFHLTHCLCISCWWLNH